MPIVTQCKQCGNDFEYQFKSQRRLFCSKSCASKFARPGNRNSGRKKTGIIRACDYCKKEIYVKQWQLRQGTGRFCSKQCYTDWGQLKKETLVCPQCGEVFQRSKSLASRTTHCSRKCLVASKTKTAIGRFHNGKPARRDPSGYVRIWEPDHPLAKPYAGWMLEHRIILEKEIGRVLERDETVHHLNGVKDDNRRENLVLIGRGDHTKVTNVEQVARRKREKNELAEYKRRFGPLT